MKKILTITIMLLIVSMAFFSCDTRDIGTVTSAMPTFELTDAKAIGDALKPLNFYNPAGDAKGITKTGNVIDFKMDDETDNHGVEVTIPANYGLYKYLVITFEVVDIKKGSAKIGFKSSVGNDITEGEDPNKKYWEVYFGTPTEKGAEGVIVIPTSKLTAASVLFSHNQWEPGDLTKPPVEYSLAVTGIILTSVE